MPTSTTNFGLSKPLVNNATDQDLWGGYLNTDLDSIDGVLLTALNLTPVTQTSTFTATAPTSGSTTTGSSKTLQLCNATGGAITANLPAVATASGMMIGIKKTDNSANAITVKGNSSDTIDGSNTYSLPSQYNYVILSCDGSTWNIIASTPPSIQTATSTTLGVVKPDNSTITISNGIITAPLTLIVTPFSVGSTIMARGGSGITFTAGSAVAASGLTVVNLCSNSNGGGGNMGYAATGDSITGTWNPLTSSSSTNSFQTLIFQRTA